MRLLQYLLQYVFVVLFTFVVLFQLGPSLIKIGLKDEKKGYTKAILQEIQISSPSENTTSYLTFDFTIDNNQYRRIFRTSEGKHIKILDFMFDNNLLKPGEQKYRIKRSQLPITVHLNQLSINQSTYVLFDGHNNLISLIINEQLILGEKNGFVKKMLAIIFGIALILIVGILFVFTIIMLVRNIGIYNKTGELPELPNPIDESIKGWKIILGKRK